MINDEDHSDEDHNDDEHNDDGHSPEDHDDDGHNVDTILSILIVPPLLAGPCSRIGCFARIIF